MMPNIKNQEKRVRTNAKKTAHNAAQRTELKSAIKAVRNSETKEDAQKALVRAYQLLDESVTSNIHHKNFASRQKSRLTKYVNSLEN